MYILLRIDSRAAPTPTLSNTQRPVYYAACVLHQWRSRMNVRYIRAYDIVMGMHEENQLLVDQLFSRFNIPPTGCMYVGIILLRGVAGGLSKYLIFIKLTLTFNRK